MPLTSVYGVEAGEQLEGAKLAVHEFNQAGGWKGRMVEIIVRDTKLDPHLAQRSTEELIMQERVNFVVGALSAADMLQISKVCQKHRMIFNAISQSDSILYRENRNPWTFHEGQNPHMTVGAVGRFVFSHYGDRVAYLNADAEFGQHSRRALNHVGRQIGVTVLKDIDYPVGSRDFTEYLLQIQAVRPQVLVFNNFGDDQMWAVRQATELGLKKEMQLVCPNFSVKQVSLAGPEVFEGVIGSCAYYWRMEEKFESAKSFNRAYRHVTGGLNPTSYSSYGYNGVRTVLESLKRADALDADLVAEQMLALRFDFCKGPQFYRRLDHQSVQSVMVVQVKSAEDMIDKNDLFEVREIIDFTGPRTFLVSRETL